MHIGLLTLQLEIPGCGSLKEKRSRLKPLLARLHREFNVSAAEVEALDTWRSAVVACALVGNDAAYVQRALQSVVAWVDENWPDVIVEADRIEVIH
jgi:hypothetical protein